MLATKIFVLSAIGKKLGEPPTSTWRPSWILAISAKVPRNVDDAKYFLVQDNIFDEIKLVAEAQGGGAEGPPVPPRLYMKYFETILLIYLYILFITWYWYSKILNCFFCV